MVVKNISYLFAVASLVLLAQSGFAADYNDGMKDEVSQDAEQLYPKRGASKVEKVAPNKVQGVDASSSSNSFQPIYILQQPTAAPNAQNQPTANVEAQAIRETRADQLRKQREEVERQSEVKLMEKLENDRINSEKDRLDRIMYNPAPSPTPSQPAAQATPAPVQQPTVVVVNQAEPATLAAREDEVAPEKNEDKSTFSIGGLGGIGNYPSVNNVNGAYAAGVLLNFGMGNGLGLEASALFSSYDVKNPYITYWGAQANSIVTTLSQTNLALGLNYRVLETRVSPVIGALAGYTRRDYSPRVYTGGLVPATTGSNAFDGGLMAGIDIKAGKKVSVGADVRYLWNLSYRTDNPTAYIYGQPGTPLESLSYYIASVNLKLEL